MTKTEEYLKDMKPEKTMNIQILKENDRIVMITEVDSNPDDPMVLDHTGSKEARQEIIQTFFKGLMGFIN